MPKPWFRLYTHVVYDPKIQRLSGDQVKLWMNLLCLAGEHDGVLPDTEDAAFTLRMTADDYLHSLDALISHGLFERVDGAIVPHNWGGRQYESDSSTERVKRFRKRSMKQDETVTVTPPDTDTDTDSDPDTDQNQIPPTGVEGGNSKPAPVGKRKKSPADAEYERNFNSWCAYCVDYLWKMYPSKRRGGKAPALKAIKQIMADLTLDQMDETLNDIGTKVDYLADSEDWKRDDGRYVPLLSTFLNQRRYEGVEMEPVYHITFLELLQTDPHMKSIRDKTGEIFRLSEDRTHLVDEDGNRRGPDGEKL